MSYKFRYYRCQSINLPRCHSLRVSTKASSKWLSSFEWTIKDTDVKKFKKLPYPKFGFQTLLDHTEDKCRKNLLTRGSKWQIAEIRPNSGYLNDYISLHWHCSSTLKKEHGTCHRLSDSRFCWFCTLWFFQIATDSTDGIEGFNEAPRDSVHDPLQDFVYWIHIDLLLCEAKQRRCTLYQNVF